MSIRYFLYVRKSTDRGDKQFNSIADQMNDMLRLADKNRLLIVGQYEEKKSAKDPHTRPLFDEMLKRIEAGEAEGILCWHLNRLSRNPVDAGQIQYMLDKGRLKSIQTLHRQYLPEDNVLMACLEFGLATQDIRSLRDGVKRGIESKLAKGWYPGAAPVGYLNIGDKGDATIIPDPERFGKVRQMWNLMLTGLHTPPQILKIANNEWGFTTRKRKKTGGKELSRSSIYLIFTNPFYAGKMMYRGIEHNGSHKPMITLAEFDRVQTLLGRKGKPRPKKYKFAYTGFIRCGECGCLITAETKRKTIKGSGEVREYTYYHCTLKRKEIACSQRTNIREEALEKMVVDLLGRCTILPEFRDWALEVLRENHEAEVKARNEIYETQHSRVAAAQKELDNLLGVRIRELISDEEYTTKRDELQREIARLQAALRETEGRAEKWVELTERGFNFATHAREAFINGDLETKKTILMALGQNPTIKDGSLSIATHDWLQPIADSYPALEQEYRKLEPPQLVGNEARTEALAPVREVWRP